MALANQQSEVTSSAAALQFGCPACHQELSISAALAGVEGPCPLCGEQIAAPLPAAHLPARLLSVPESIIPETNGDSAWEREDEGAWPSPKSSPAQTEEPPLTTMQHVFCGACGCELAIDPELAHLEGGPCPRCQTWIDLQGRQGPAVDHELTEAHPGGEPVVDSEGWGANDLAAREESASFDGRGSSPGPEEAEASRSSAVEELNRTVEARSNGRQDLNFRRMTPNRTIERRRVKKRKRRRQLPPEFYVGHAAGDLDARGQETAERMRRVPFPEEASDGQVVSVSMENRRRAESLLKRCLPVVFGVIIPLLGGLYAALHFEFIDPADLRFWTREDPFEEQPALDPLAASLEQTERVLHGRAKESYRLVERAIQGFFAAETWETAQTYLVDDGIPANSEALAFLKMFPREAFRGAEVRVIDYRRIPQTERFVFTTHVSKTYSLRFMSVEAIHDLLDVGRSLVLVAQLGSNLHVRIFDATGAKIFDQPEYEMVRLRDLGLLKEALQEVGFPEPTEMSEEQSKRLIDLTMAAAGRRGEQRLTFMVGEEMKGGVAKLHALQLYQSWKRTLTEFLETSGAPGSRYYVALRRSSEVSSISFPENGRYIRLEVQDLLVAQPWIKDVYVREGSWAGTRLLANLNGGWAMGVLDLEWMRGPTGDAFVHVAGVYSSPWGDYPN